LLITAAICEMTRCRQPLGELGTLVSLFGRSVGAGRCKWKVDIVPELAGYDFSRIEDRNKRKGFFGQDRKGRSQVFGPVRNRYPSHGNLPKFRFLSS
jgi:hypothetical protein